MVKSALAERMRRIDVAPLLGKTLEAAMTEERHVPLVDGIVTWAGRTLDANEDMIRDMVHKRAGWILRLAGLDEKLADAIVDGLRKLTIDMAVDPHHPLRAKAEEGLARVAAADQRREEGGAEDIGRRLRHVRILRTAGAVIRSGVRASRELEGDPAVARSAGRALQAGARA